MRVRRRRPCVLQIEDRPFPDLAALAQGRVTLVPTTQALLVCPFTGVPILVAADELPLLARLGDQDWTEATDLVTRGWATETGLRSMVARQVLVGDGPESADLRRNEEALEAVGWAPTAALFHAQTRWSGQGGEHSLEKGDLNERLRTHAETFGPPPPEFVFRVDARAVVDLPAAPSLGAPWTGRRTTRAFVQDRPLPLADLSAVLAGVFGPRGTEDVGEGLRFLTKTSPSGGGLHPVEAYPFVAQVEGLVPGIYHYRAADHRLELLEPLAAEEVRRLVSDGTAGQTYFAEAQAAILHVVRFDRAYWKYRRHPKLYKTLMMDVAHLSQSLYLMAAERNLGAWFTAAINDADLGTRLGLDPLREAAVAFNGLGLADWSRTERHFRRDE
jgi:putative peptide maturation dehydrogenase